MKRKLEVVTTYNKKYYDICGKKMIQTFIEHWPKDVTLYCYYQEQEPEILADNVQYIDLYGSNPQLKRFVFDNQIEPKKNGMIDGKYDFQSSLPIKKHKL